MVRWAWTQQQQQQIFPIICHHRQQQQQQRLQQQQRQRQDESHTQTIKSHYFLLLIRVRFFKALKLRLKVVKNDLQCLNKTGGKIIIGKYKNYWCIVFKMKQMNKLLFLNFCKNKSEWEIGCLTLKFKIRFWWKISLHYCISAFAKMRKDGSNFWKGFSFQSHVHQCQLGGFHFSTKVLTFKREFWNSH